MIQKIWWIAIHIDGQLTFTGVRICYDIIYISCKNCDRLRQCVTRKGIQCLGLSVDHLSAEFIASGHQVFVNFPCVLHKRPERGTSCTICTIATYTICACTFSFWGHCCNIVPKFIHRVANKYTHTHKHKSTLRHLRSGVSCHYITWY